MANIVKLIIPLSGIDMSLQDLFCNNGFVNGYIEDINRPSLRQHLFLLYKADLESSEFIARDERFRKCDRLYSRKVVYYNKIPYMLYTFSLIGVTLLKILEGMTPYKDDEYLQIHKFWNFTDDFINQMLCNRGILYKTNDPEAVVPEIDYLPDETEDEYLLKLKNPGTLKLNIRVYFFKYIRIIYHTYRLIF